MDRESKGVRIIVGIEYWGSSIVIKRGGIGERGYI